MAGLNVNMEVIASIVQEIISLYILWDRYKEDGQEGSTTSSVTSTGRKHAASKILPHDETPAIVTPIELTLMLERMRQNKTADMAHPANGRPVAFDKRLERTQNA